MGAKVITIKAKMTWDATPILSAAEKAQRRMLFRAGGYIVRTAKNSIRRGAPSERSQPGSAPIGHGLETYRNFIRFAVDARAKTMVAGSTLLGGTRGGDAPPEKIEYGGTE